jgi:antitoxin component of RelBE/YafQ-DinJ toxin-antitoxin module
MSPEAKAVRFNLRISETEQAMMNELADAMGVSGSDVIRMLIRKEHGERFGASKATKKPPKK